VIREPEDELKIRLESNGKGFRQTLYVCRNPFYFARIPALSLGYYDTWPLNNFKKKENENEKENHKKSNRPQEELQRKRNRTLPLHTDQREIKIFICAEDQPAVDILLSAAGVPPCGNENFYI